MDQALCVMFDQLDRRYATSEGVCDLGNWLQYFAYDVMGTLTFSKRYSFLEEGRDVNGILMAVEKFMNLSSVVREVRLYASRNPALTFNYRWVKCRGWTGCYIRTLFLHSSKTQRDLKYLPW